MESARVSVIVIAMTLVVAGIQRVVGFGFGMVMAPFMVLILSPHEGVMLVNFLSIIAPGLILWQLRSYIEWDKFFWLVGPAVLIMRLFTLERGVLLEHGFGSVGVSA